MTALRAEGCGIALTGDEYKVSVTGLAFWVRWHDKHYDDEPPSVAFPPLVPYGTTFPPRVIGRATKGKRLYGQARRLTSPDLHILCRMCTVDNKAPQSNPFTQRIAKNKVPPPGGRWWCQPPKGVHFPRPQGGCQGFIIKGRLLSIHRRPPQPSAAKPLSNLRTLGAIAPSNF